MLWRGHEIGQGLRRSRTQGAGRRLLSSGTRPRSRRSARWPPVIPRCASCSASARIFPTASPPSTRRSNATGMAARSRPRRDGPGHDHLHGAGRCAVRCGRAQRGGASGARGDDGARARPRRKRRDPQSLSFDRTGRAFARASALAHQRRDARPASSLRLRRLRRAGHRHGRDGDGASLARPCRARQGRRAAEPQCRLRRVGAVWTGLEQADPLGAFLRRGDAALLRSLSARRSRRRRAETREAGRSRSASLGQDPNRR